MKIVPLQTQIERQLISQELGQKLTELQQRNTQRQEPVKKQEQEKKQAVKTEKPKKTPTKKHKV